VRNRINGSSISETSSGSKILVVRGLGHGLHSSGQHDTAVT
jgi:hypothetical protein